MKQTIIHLWKIVAVSTLLTANTQAALSPEESDEYNGQEAKAFEIKTVQGHNFALKENHGHVIIVNFFASWCPPCRSEIGQLTQLHNQYSKQGLLILGFAVDPILTLDTVKDVKPMVENLGIPYSISLATKQIADDYKFKGIPTNILIDKDGKIAKTFYGYQDAKKLEVMIKKLLEQKPAKKE